MEEKLKKAHDEQEFVVIEKIGFCTTKKKKDILKDDNVMYLVKEDDCSESIIHGRRRSRDY